jgi:hypothetical protein
MMSSPSVGYTDFCRALPAARAIYNKYEYNDEHSQWLGRWIKRAERHLSQARHESTEVKQGITDKLISKLMKEILVSPYDRAPFVFRTEKSPVLFKGILFPYWMLEDILMTIGYADKLQFVAPHAFIDEMLEWSTSLRQSSHSTSSSKSTALVKKETGGSLVALDPQPAVSHLDSSLMLSIKYEENPELALIKLLTYRNLMKNAFKEMVLRHVKRGIKHQTRQIVKFGQEQKALMTNEKAQIVHQNTVHAQTVAKQHEEIVELQETTQTIMKDHYEDLITRIHQTEERLKKVQQESREKEAQIQALINAQRNLQ